MAAVESYFAAVAAASGSATDAYAVAPQYGDVNGPGEYHVIFRGSEDVYLDTVNSLPPAGTVGEACEDPAEIAKGEPCITNKDLQKEINFVRVAKGLEGGNWLTNLENVYFVFTPPKVGSCFFGHEEEETAKEGNACAFASGGYCAYHSDFEGSKGEPVSPIYANIPDSGEVEGCDTYEHRNGAGGVDATLDITSHEHNEMITDPLVSTGWTDVIGQEIADKCVPPDSGLYSLSESYGIPLGGESAEAIESPVGSKKFTIKPGTLYNQIIGSGRYWLQREWSNSAFEGEGGCVQRMLPVSFTPPAQAEATVPATFDGSPSGESGDPTYWIWSFGDGMQTGTPEAKTAHTYARAGTYTVTLTAFDAYGNSNTHTMTVAIGGAPPPPLVSIEPVSRTNTVTVTTPPPPILAYNAAQIAERLGLSKSGTKLSGLGTISLGHAECPPACVVTLKLTTTVPTGKGRHRKKSTKQIGYVRLTIADKGTGTLALQLSPTGRALLREHHGLSVTLTVTVQGQEGGIWPIERTLHLSASGRVSRHALRASFRRF